MKTDCISNNLGAFFIKYFSRKLPINSEIYDPDK